MSGEVADAFGYTADLRIDRHLAQLLRLRVSQLNNCTYCLNLHYEAARQGHAHPPSRLHGERGVQRRGNPYGTSYTSGKRVEGPDEKTLEVARYQGQRLARYAAVVADAREADAFRVKRPRPERFQAAALD